MLFRLTTVHDYIVGQLMSASPKDLIQDYSTEDRALSANDSSGIPVKKAKMD